MKGLSKKLVCLFASLTFGTAAADNQTPDTTPISTQGSLPFTVLIQQTNFQLPHGLQAYAYGVYQGQWIFIAGRNDGLHSFNVDPFPPQFQNRSIYVVNPTTRVVKTRSLTDAGSGLNQLQIDSLSVTFPEFYQDGDTLYLAGGYGIDTGSDTYGTKPTLTAINLPGIVQWVMQPGNKSNTVAKNIRQVNNPIFQIEGGRMFKLGNVSQLIFGETFTGRYSAGGSGIYSFQARRFQITNVGGKLGFSILPSMPSQPQPGYRRRDLNIVPALLNQNNKLEYGFIGYGGVFTLTNGVWTVPVVFGATGDPVMANPDAAGTFKQGMSQYACATANFYSTKSTSMYSVFFGGISYGFFNNGVFETDPEIPFTNEVTTVKMDKSGNFSQYLMDNQYPVIPSTGVNAGNQLLFGSAGFFIPASIQMYPNSVINLDNIRQPTVIGYIVGGIASTVPNTQIDPDTAASDYVFQVTLMPRN
jgi:hypothetical protein